MTDMRRITISVPQDMDDRVLALRKRKDYVRCSYSELLRRMIEIGLQAECNQEGQGTA